MIGDDMGLTPLSEDSQADCDCDAIFRWRRYAQSLAITTTVLTIVCLGMGWALSIHWKSDTPTHVRADLKGIEARMKARAASVEKRLDRDLAVKPAEVLAEVRKINARLDRLEAKVNN